jgi:hypothetical protein
MLQRNEKNQRPFRGIQATLMNFLMTRVFFWSMTGRTSRPRSRCLRRPSHLLLGPWTPSSSMSTTIPFSYLQIHDAIRFGDAEPPGHQAKLPIPRRAVGGGLWTTVAACHLGFDLHEARDVGSVGQQGRLRLREDREQTEEGGVGCGGGRRHMRLVVEWNRWKG